MENLENPLVLHMHGCFFSPNLEREEKIKSHIPILISTYFKSCKYTCIYVIKCRIYQ